MDTSWFPKHTSAAKKVGNPVAKADRFNITSHNPNTLMKFIVMVVQPCSDSGGERLVQPPSRWKHMKRTSCKTEIFDLMDSQ